MNKTYLFSALLRIFIMFYLLPLGISYFLTNDATALCEWVKNGILLKGRMLDGYFLITSLILFFWGTLQFLIVAKAYNKTMNEEWIFGGGLNNHSPKYEWFAKNVKEWYWLDDKKGDSNIIEFLKKEGKELWAV